MASEKHSAIFTSKKDLDIADRRDAPLIAHLFGLKLCPRTILSAAERSLSADCTARRGPQPGSEHRDDRAVGRSAPLRRSGKWRIEHSRPPYGRARRHRRGRVGDRAHGASPEAPLADIGRPLWSRTAPKVRAGGRARRLRTSACHETAADGRAAAFRLYYRNLQPSTSAWAE